MGVGRNGFYDEAVASCWQGLDVSRVFVVIPERVANVADGVTQCLASAVARAPDFLQEFIMFDDCAGPASKTYEYFCRLWRQALRAVLPRYSSF